MRFSTTSLSGFHAWLPGRVMLPVGFALAIAAGTYVFAEGEGFERGKAAQASATERAQESVKTLARLVAQPIELDDEPTEKGDRLDIPTMIRAIEPSAVYRPPQKPAVRAASRAEGAKQAKPVAAAGQPESLSPDAVTMVSLPVGVERFDRCEANCDTRDPKVVRSSYPVVVGAQDVAPGPNTPPAPVLARAEPEDEGFLGLPPLPSASEIVDRTVQGTSAAYDGMKQAVSGALDILR